MLPSRQDRNAARVPQNSSSMAAAEGSGRRQAIKHSCYVLPTRASVRFVPAFERQVFAQRAARGARRVDKADQRSALYSVQRGMHARTVREKPSEGRSLQVLQREREKWRKGGKQAPDQKAQGGCGRGYAARPASVVCVFCVGRGVGEKRHTQQEGSREWGDKKKSGAGARKRRRGCGAFAPPPRKRAASHLRRRKERGGGKQKRGKKRDEGREG